MKSIIVYYSLEENTDYIAKEIAKRTGAKLLRLETVKPFAKKGFKKFFQGGMSAVRKKTPELMSYNFDASEYETIYLGSPVWAGRYSAPMRTFLEKEHLQGKKIKLFMCLSGTGDKKPLAYFEHDLAGNQVVSKISFQDPYTSKRTLDEKRLEQFCK